MSYPLLALLGVLAVVLVDLTLTRTRLLTRRAFWASYAIVLFFQLITNAVLTGLPIVRYDADQILGWRVLYAPVEDVLFGFALVLLTLSIWVWTGRHDALAGRHAGRQARPGRGGPGRPRSGG